MKRCNNCFEQYNDSYKACPHCGYIAGNPPKELFHLFPGMELSEHYIVGEVLGFGGFGVTYKAWDKKLETVVAIKEYYPSGIVNRVPGEKPLIIYAKKRENEFYFGKERFLQEARNMAKFHSEPNIINVFEYFEENNTAYIVMEFLEGISLKAYLHDNGGKLDLNTSLKIINAIENALIIIHSKSIIHRDVSPDNIFLCTNGAIKLIDFGAARFSQNENQMMTIILKPGFAPPEQYEKVNKQGPWTDVYALGATFYYMITGKKPEESTNRKINDTVVAPNEIDPEIPEYVSNAIMKAMAIDRELRFKNIELFKQALDQKKKVLPVAVEKKKRKIRRNFGVIAASAVILLGAFACFYMWNNEKDKQTLPDCSINVWYCKCGDSELDQAEENAYNTIIDDFRASFPNVNIILTGFDESEYVDALKAEDNLPNVFEYDESLQKETFISDKPLSLGEIYSSSETKNCSLLQQAQSYFGEYYLPLGFDTPIAFINNQEEVFKQDTITSLNAFTKTSDTSTDLSGDAEDTEITFANDYADLAKMFPNADAYYQITAKEEFLSGDLLCYGSLSSNYFDVRDRLPGQYEILSYDTDKVYCHYSNVWAANDLDKKENKVSVKLLEFMLNNNAQDVLHIQNKSGHFPINEDVIDVFITVNNEFDGFFDNKDKYIFEK